MHMGDGNGVPTARIEAISARRRGWATRWTFTLTVTSLGRSSLDLADRGGGGGETRLETAESRWSGSKAGGGALAREMRARLTADLQKGRMADDGKPA
jgi:hypothetical protein